jgi:hypothetical protein
MTWGGLGLALGVVVALTSSAAWGQQIVDLELAIAIDVSASVDGGEHELQMRGIAMAFRDPNVISAIQAAGGMGIAVSVVEWSGASQQRVSVDWHLVNDESSAESFSSAVLGSQRSGNRGLTAIGNAIRFCHLSMQANRYEGLRKVINVSGDGKANDGIAPGVARQSATGDNIIINGLAILNEDPSLYGYYEKAVIGGPGAFAYQARNYKDFVDTMRRKLIREIALLMSEGPTDRGIDVAANARH